VKQEVSHVNSLQEIPENASAIPAFRKGNLLFHDSMSRSVYVADAALRKILWKFSLAPLGYELVHDLQVLPNGNLLIFVNFTEKEPKRSRVVEFDPSNGKEIWTAGPEDLFSELQGSVQVLDDGTYLVSHRKGESSAVSRMKRDGSLSLITSVSAIFTKPVQAVRKVNLQSFLDHNSGL
jgi:outer membrane protein assembly factor BamB